MKFIPISLIALFLLSCKPNTAAECEAERVAQSDAEFERKKQEVDSLFDVAEDYGMQYSYEERITAVQRLRKLVPSQDSLLSKIELEIYILAGKEY